MHLTGFELSLARTPAQSQCLSVLLLLAGLSHLGALADRSPVGAANELAPAWGVGFGKEFWRGADRAATAQAQQRTGEVLPGTVVDAAIERVTHAFHRETPGTAASVQSGAYRASLEGDGLVLAPADPRATDPAVSAQEPARARFRTLAVRRGEQELFHRFSPPRAWSVAGNTAQALLEADSGMLEHYEARRAGIAVTWVIPKPPAGAGDLVIEAGPACDRDREAPGLLSPN